MKSTYRHELFRKLRDFLVHLEASEARMGGALRAEHLLEQLQDGTTYAYLHRHITGSEPEAGGDIAISADDARHDLRQLVKDVLESAAIPMEIAAQPVYTVAELSRRFHVSTKTISRWREHGLVGAQFVQGGRKRLGFLQTAVDRFVRANPNRVRRGGRFSHMTDRQREAILDQARRLVELGDPPAEVIRQIAQAIGRSPETIRYTVQKFDRENKNPEQAIFAKESPAMADQTKCDVYREYQLGSSVESLSKRYGQTKSAISRLIRHKRLQCVMDLPLEYVPNADFERAEAAERFLGSMPITKGSARRARIPKGLPSYLASLYEVPLLSREQELYLFGKLNFLKYRAACLRNTLHDARSRARLLDEIESLHAEAVATKNQIVKSNLRLVVSIAKRYANNQDDLFDLVSDGNISLMRAAEKFDYSLGNKFSTYASWAIKKNFARNFVTRMRHQDRFRNGQEELLASKTEYRADPYLQETTQLQREEQVNKMLHCLDWRERRIVASRFGLARGTEPKTLKEIGAELGVSKERVRQIEARAIRKMRQVAADRHLEISAA